MRHKCNTCGKERDVNNPRLQAIADSIIVKLRPSELKLLEIRRPGTLCSDGMVHTWRPHDAP